MGRLVHKHRIKPGHEGGDYSETNVVYLTATQHAMWHFAEWKRTGSWQHRVAWRGLAGLITHEEAALEAMRMGGRKGGINAGGKNKGGTISEEQKQAISKANTGRKRTPEEREKMKNAWAERKASAEWGEIRKRMSEGCKNRDPETRKGRKLSEETKRKIGDAHRGMKKPKRKRLG